MKVELMDYTGKGVDEWYAADLLIWTKRTRVEMSPDGFDDIAGWPQSKKVTELEYMAATIPSSWEFVDYTFLITGATRALTHQLVRQRFGVSFAQQTMQILDVSQGAGWTHRLGPTIAEHPALKQLFLNLMTQIASTHRLLIAGGAKIEEAREALPMGIHTNIVMKANLRMLCDMLRKRISPRNAGEMQELAAQLRLAMLAVHPWVGVFVDRTADVVARDMYKMLEKVPDPKLRTDLTKCVDQLLTNIGTEQEAA